MSPQTRKKLYVSMVLLTSAVIGLSAVAMALAARRPVWESLRYGAMAFAGGFAIVLAVVKTLGLLEDADG